MIHMQCFSKRLYNVTPRVLQSVTNKDTMGLCGQRNTTYALLALDLPAQVSSKLTYTHTNSHDCRMKKG